MLGWVKYFLCDRKQRVVINGEFLPLGNGSSGVPQGSVLGHVIVLVYINDLPDVIECIVKMFADDTKMYCFASYYPNICRLQTL